MLSNPCPSADKDLILGIDRSRDRADHILLLGYVTGAAQQDHMNSPDATYQRPGSMISGTLSYAINMVNTIRERFNASERRVLNLPEPPLPPGYKLDFCYLETYGNEQDSIRSVAKFMERVNLSGIIGPQETCSVEAAMASTYNVPMISHYCDDVRIVFHPLTNRPKLFTEALLESAESFGMNEMNILFFLSFVRVLDTIDRHSFGKAFDSVDLISVAIFDQGNCNEHALNESVEWNKVAYLTTQSDEYAFTIEVIHSMLIRNGIELLYTNTFPHPQLYGLSSNFFTQVVEESYRKTRVYLVVGEGYDALGLLDTMHEVGLLKTGKCDDVTTLLFYIFHLSVASRHNSIGDYFVIGIDKRAHDASALQIWSNLENDETIVKSCVRNQPDCYQSYMQLTLTPLHQDRCEELQEYNMCYLKKAPFNFTLSSGKLFRNHIHVSFSDMIP
ncbi:hypothetical protein P879_03346 [Paragonimus westermani]|uniref:Receptor ligand binding region domain-containing protein n=1 Tax=Paragonimus westermani TaxID=34504 RepID=A0A8T0DA19_9TREM|nr:hypothetical protein P879_03346 [Paragonimus westermani]